MNRKHSIREEVLGRPLVLITALPLAFPTLTGYALACPGRERKFMLHKPKRFAGTAAMLLFTFAMAGCGDRQHREVSESEVGNSGDRYLAAKRLFAERCKESGLIIKRTVADIEGIELTKIRPEIPWGGKEYFDPMFPGAAMAIENQGEDYIKQFLMTEIRYVMQPDRRGRLTPSYTARDDRDMSPERGYRFVEFLDAQKNRFRCVPTWKDGETGWTQGQHRCDPIERSSTRYAVDYEDIVTPQDRALWVAGTKLKVIDKDTGETIAQLTKYVWDPGFGAGSTGRWPWQHAASAKSTTCPTGFDQPLHQDTRYFVDKVLLPKQGEK